MNWNDFQNTALSDMLRDELVLSFVRENEAEYMKHRAAAGRFAECGNHAAALREIETANEYRRRASEWRDVLESGENS